MANNRMWLVNHDLHYRMLLAEHDGERWCWVAGTPWADDQPALPAGGMAASWCIYYGSESDLTWHDYAEIGCQLTSRHPPRMWQPHATPAWDWTDGKVG